MYSYKYHQNRYSGLEYVCIYLPLSWQTGPTVDCYIRFLVFSSVSIHNQCNNNAHHLIIYYFLYINLRYNELIMVQVINLYFTPRAAHRMTNFMNKQKIVG